MVSRDDDIVGSEVSKFWHQGLMALKASRQGDDEEGIEVSCG